MGRQLQPAHLLQLVSKLFERLPGLLDLASVVVNRLMSQLVKCWKLLWVQLLKLALQSV